MIYITFGLILISFIGYFNFLRSRLRISFGNAVFFLTCAFLLIMMLGGLLHIMKITAYLIFGGGFAFIAGGIINKIRNKTFSLQFVQSSGKLYFRSEYAFYSLVVLIGFEIFYNYRGELGAGDFWSAWYDHFYYLALNGKWSDIGYSNYASAYAMILNGGAYFFGTISGNYGTQMYVFSHYILNIGLLMPIFAMVNWRKAPWLEALIFAVIILLNGEIPKLSVTVIATISTVLCYRIVVSNNKLQFITAFISLLAGILFAYFILAQPMDFSSLALDSSLGCAVVGTVVCLALGYSIKWRRNRGLWLFILPLLVLPLIKPTGIIPAISLSALLTGLAICRLVRLRKQMTDYKKWISRIAVIILLAAAPWLSYKLWGVYVVQSKLKFQHQIPVTVLMDRAHKQFSAPIPDEVLENWRKKIRYMSTYHFLLDKPKSCFEKTTEKILLPYLFKYHLGDDLLPGKSLHKQQSHVLVIGALQLLFCLAATFFIKRKSSYLLLLLWATGAFSLYIPLQYYMTPMFTDIPGIFRYIWPYVAILWGLLFSAWNTAWQYIGRIKSEDNMSKKIWFASRIGLQIALTVCLCMVFFPILSSAELFNSKSTNFSQSSLPLGIMAIQSSSESTNIYLSDPWKEGLMSHFLIKRNLITNNKNLPILHLSKNKFLPEFTLFAGETTGRSPYKIPAGLPEGIYNVKVNRDLSVEPILIYNNPDALDLLNRKYSLSDTECWQNNSLNINIDGQFKNFPGNRLSRSQEWSTRTFPKN